MGTGNNPTPLHRGLGAHSRVARSAAEARRMTAGQIGALLGCAISLAALAVHGIVVFPAALVAGHGLGEAVGGYLFAFAVITHIGALLVYLSYLASEGWLRFFRVSVHRAAIAAAMLFVILFQQITQSVGGLPGYPAPLASLFLIVIGPIFYLGWWLAFDRNQPLLWNTVPRMLAYPVLYVLAVLARGAITHHYPTPLLDVMRHGYVEVIANAVMLFILFGALCVLVVVVDRLVPRR